ncbi:MAG: hypothetical protein D3917_05600 [Candidatus Electrothrix sp. AX5]|nr:hypothetical protein [Candidatus Electrothrix sp. AX5]
MVTEIRLYHAPDGRDNETHVNITYERSVAPAKPKKDTNDGPEITIEYKMPPPDTRVFEQKARRLMHMGPTLVNDAVDTPSPDYILDTYGSFIQRHYVGDLVVKVTWKNRKTDATQSAEKTFPAGNTLNSATSVSQDFTEFTLSRMIGGKLSQEEDGVASGDWSSDHGTPEGRGGLVADILSHIDKNLRAGFGHFWKKADEIHCCKDGVPLRDINLADLSTEQETEECWAQHVAEFLTCTTYCGPGWGMGAPAAAGFPKNTDPGHRKDSWVMRQYLSEDNPMYSLMYTCQQLASMGLIFRGHESIAHSPLDSHAPSIGDLPGSTIITPNTKGEWPEWTSEGGGWVKVSQPLKSDRLKTGTCFYFLKDNPKPKKDFPHVGLTLQILRGRNKLQMIDTGAWISDLTGPLPCVPDSSDKRGGYNFDTPYKELISKGGTTYSLTGIRVPPPSQNLRDAIAKMRRARPFGVARLVVTIRGDNSSITQTRTVWVSRLTPMYRADEAYSTARLFGALRGCPHRKHLDVRWQIFTPKYEQTLRAATEKNRQWWHAESNLKPYLNPLIEIGLQKSGVPLILQRCTDKHTFQFPLYLTTFNTREFSAQVRNNSRLTTAYPHWADTTPHINRISRYLGGTKS